MFKGFEDISSIANDTGVFRDSGVSDIERRLMILEEENKQLRDLGFFKSEVERLKLELDYAESLKHKYRNMYNDAAVKLMYLQNTDSMIFEEDDQIVNLNKKVEMLVSANEDLKGIFDQARTDLLAEQNENNRLTEEVIPQLENQIFMIKRERGGRTASMCVQRGGAAEVTSGIGRTPSPLKRSPQKAKTIRENQERKVSSVGKNSYKGFYMPSFMRSKRPGK